MANEKTAIVTGSTDGLGRMVATCLATEHGFRVLVHGRDQARGKDVVDAITRAGGKAMFVAADLASLAEVRKLAGEIKAACPRIDLLINNAGLGSGGSSGTRQESHDGFELRFAVNYLAGFLLTHLLLGKIKASAPARIVNVSSLGQQEIEFDDVMLTRGYSGGRAYCQSKLAQILFTIDLASKLQGSDVTANCLHPATYMDTTMVRQAGVNPWSTVEQGANAVMNLAVAPEFSTKSGLFFDGLRRGRPNAQAFDEKARAQLRALSLNLTGLSA